MSRKIEVEIGCNFPAILLICLILVLLGLTFCSKAKATPVDGIFRTIKNHVHVTKACGKPAIWYSDDLIRTICQRYALPGYRALACFIENKNTIIMPQRCENTDDHECTRLWRHELGRAAYKCNGVSFDDPIPREIIDLEDVE